MGFAKAGDFERPHWPAASAKNALTLYAPLTRLLRSGGDRRLTSIPGSSLDRYGCAAAPQSGILECASSTATTISSRAYDRAEISRFELLKAALSDELPDAFDERIESMRQELLNLLGLQATDIVFAPSGTDAALYAGFVAGQGLGGAFTNILIGAAETGSGAPLAVAGRHFDDRTALGENVTKGGPIEGFCPVQSHVRVALRDRMGAPLPLAEIDACVVEAIEEAVGHDGRVLLHAMDCSKTGLSGPSLACLDFISQRWPSQVLVVVDACQFRCSVEYLRSYLARNVMVLITGSKYFTGPPFSGALLVPQTISTRVVQTANVPSGLVQYTGRSSWPRSWRSVRSRLGQSVNFGEWLRWEAALEEMRAYFSVPTAFRAASLRTYSKQVSKFLKDISGLEHVAARAEQTPNKPGNDEMDVQTIFPFLASGRDAPLTFQAASLICRSLRTNAAENICGYQIGRPVDLSIRGAKAGVLRVSASARLVSRAWTAGDPLGSQRRLASELELIGTALEATARRAAHERGN